ncbi:hypothetical protein C0991_002881 [Blastosporella zonata]|nr:hypothetical protein C0991_002881 [Blastosporella zonata]
MDHSRGQSPSQLSASSSKYHHPYFTPAEVKYLSEKQRGKLTETQEEKARQSACGFLEALGARIGFPRKTTATAQNLYHRFHLFFPRKDFNYHVTSPSARSPIYQCSTGTPQDVSLAALYVSTKMHDTLKKPRELLAVSYAVRFPDLAAKSKHPGGEVDLDSMDPQVVEHDRQRLLAVERLILETICFNFTARMPFLYVIKIGRALKGSIYVAALLSSFEQPVAPAEEGYLSSHDLASYLGKHGRWEKQYQSQVEDLEVIAHAMLDLLLATTQNPSANTSPSTPSSPAPHLSIRHQYEKHSLHASSPYNNDQLIRLKISMRETEHPPRPRQPLGNADPSALYGGDDVPLLGRNEGTVRFLFGPPGVVNSV